MDGAHEQLSANTVARQHDQHGRAQALQDQADWPLLSALERARLRFLAFRMVTGRIRAPQPLRSGTEAICEALMAPPSQGRPELWDEF